MVAAFFYASFLAQMGSVLTAEMTIFPPSRFTDYFLRINRIATETFHDWIFRPGMLFQDNNIWWKDPIPRKTPHEGIDLQAYRDYHGNIIPLDGSTRIPALFHGTIAQIFGDFLGESIHITHDIYREEGLRLNSLYGHIIPAEGLKAGDQIHKGDDIAIIAVDQGRVVPPHLHLTTFWTPTENPAETINWTTINDLNVAELFDPMQIICDSYAVLE
ncbi:MAG: peptidoglycan DD-metalloendopeptidase family protein [Desulfobulbaceae bacterium]|nr:peptidoglycan DD-metalloendopeptidase family protein [Desulfobulbaceae bacterium]